MADEVVTATPDVPAAAPAPTDTPAATTETPAATDASTVTPTEESYTKFDVKSLTPEGLRAYKKLQADYTRARQADKSKFEEMQKQLTSFQPLLNDPDVRAKAYYLQYGKYPDGYQPTFAPPQQTRVDEINPDEIDNPVLKKLYLDNQRLQQDAEKRSKEESVKMEKETIESVKAWHSKLPEAHKELWNKNLERINKIATRAAREGVPVNEALEEAFTAACGKELVELAKLEAVNALKVKAQQPKPETGVNVVGDLAKGSYKTAEEAVRAAIAQSRK